MAHRHKVQAKASGGKTRPFYAGGESHVAHEATDPHSHKRGGKAKKDGGQVVGLKSGGRLDKRRRGGGVESGESARESRESRESRKSGGKVEKRARGGGVGVGADKSPFSSAHIAGHKRGGAPAHHKHGGHAHGHHGAGIDGRSHHTDKAGGSFYARGGEVSGKK